jgi:hypothetical protein
MVVCILPGLSGVVTNGLPLIRCRTVAWSWLESGLLFFSNRLPEIVSSELNPLEGIVSSELNPLGKTDLLRKNTKKIYKAEIEKQTCRGAAGNELETHLSRWGDWD